MDRKQRGATIVEAAFVLPILFMFLLGILEFGRAYNEYQVLTNAAREAARFAVAPYPGSGGQLPCNGASNCAPVQQIATNWLNSAGITPSTAPTTVACSSFTNPITGNTLNEYCTSVTVTAPFSFLAPRLLFGSNGPSVNLSSTATMRQETN
jgi:Flp pilus assembly protein TadG